jgi:hypothetical protein
MFKILINYYPSTFDLNKHLHSQYIIGIRNSGEDRNKLKLPVQLSYCLVYILLSTWMPFFSIKIPLILHQPSIPPSNPCKKQIDQLGKTKRNSVLLLGLRMHADGERRPEEHGTIWGRVTTARRCFRCHCYPICSVLDSHHSRQDICSIHS